MSTIHEYLQGADMPQYRLAEAVGITAGHLSAIISGDRRPSLRVAVAIERATGGAVPASSWVAQPVTEPGE